VPAALSTIALIVRTHLEDAYLASELNGYVDYREQTRFRLLPKVW
jgi:protein-S-isoprenylcysteine O-methyltransferase Ste14